MERTPHAEVKSFYALNEWTKEVIAEVCDLLESGHYVHLGSDALGHTRAVLTERDGIEKIKNIFGDRVEVVEDSWGFDVLHLIDR